VSPSSSGGEVSPGLLASVAASGLQQALAWTSAAQSGALGASLFALLAIYARQKDPNVKSAVLEALFIQNNADALVSLSRKESDSTMKRRIVEKLSLMPNQSARQYMLELLEK
jgi:hypothetical protein